MVLQSARLVAVPWEAALLEFLQRVDGRDLTWWLYGSAALAVRGVEILPGDIDLSVSDAYLAGELCDDILVTPVEELDGWVARCVARAFCHATIEWLSEPDTGIDDPGDLRERGRSSVICLKLLSGAVTPFRCHRFLCKSLAVSVAA